MAPEPPSNSSSVPPQPGDSSGAGTPASNSGKPPSSDDQLIAAAMQQIDAAAPKGSSGKGTGTPGLGSIFADELASLPADVFPGYQLLRELRRGGQGVVYQALHKGTKRKVAIKVLREGPFASVKERARFEREIEILAQLNHPNIVAIHDSGVTAGAGPNAPSAPGTPGAMHFFVMDYISGQSLDSWLAASKRTLQEVLGVFAKICDAVNSAHLKGIIHRDLKPSNIRVDQANEPHVLDFGLAKSGATDAGSAAEVMTMTGDFLGSLHWASPEQAEGSISKIDVRTDVYSLGVMLYHALTGRFPYAVIGNVRDVLDNILKQAPARPSTSRAATKVRIDDEVETIVLKCLSKERDRRYQNAGELARDLRAYQSGEPIEAKRDSGWYVVRKTVTRHRVAAGTIGLIAATVLGAAIVSTVFWRQADAARRVAVQREATTQAYASFLEQIFTGMDPDVAQGRDVSVLKEILWTASGAAEKKFANEPRTLADVRDVLGQTYTLLGQYDLADAPLTAALDWRSTNLGASAPDTAKSKHHLAILRFTSGKNDLARPLAEQASAAFRAIDPVSPDTAESLMVLGWTCRWLGDYPASQAAYDEALAIRVKAFGDASEKAGEVRASMGQLALAQRNFTDGEKLMRDSLANVLGSVGEKTVAAAIARRNLAGLLRDRGRPEDLAEATTLLTQAADSLRELYAKVNPNHPLLSLTLTRLAQVQQSRGDLAAAESLAKEAFEMRRGGGATDFYVGSSALLLGELQMQRDRSDDASASLKQARQFLTPSRTGRPAVFARLARFEAELAIRRNDQHTAIVAADECLQLRRDAKPPSPRDVAEASILRARAEALASPVRAAAMLRAAIAATPPPDLLSDAQSALAESLLALNEPEAAAASAITALDLARTASPPDAARARRALALLVRISDMRRSPADRARYQAELDALH